MKSYHLFLFFALATSCSTQNSRSIQIDSSPVFNLSSKILHWTQTSPSPFRELIDDALKDKRLIIKSSEKLQKYWPDIIAAALVENRDFSVVHLSSASSASAKNLNVTFREQIFQRDIFDQNHYWLFVPWLETDENFLSVVHELAHIAFQNYLDSHKKVLELSFPNLFDAVSEKKSTMPPDIYDYLSETFARLAEFAVVCEWLQKKYVPTITSPEFVYLHAQSWSDVQEEISRYLVRTYRFPADLITKKQQHSFLEVLVMDKVLSTIYCPKVGSPSKK